MEESDSASDHELLDDWEGNSTDSEDRDLRDRFSRGDLKSGHLYRQQLTENNIPEFAKTINNISGIKKRLQSLKQSYPEQWIERMSVNAPLVPVNDGENKGKQADVNVQDDFNRELSFYQQAQKGVISAFDKLRKLGVETERPEDYFAEMLKSESHMQRIRERLVNQEKKEVLLEKARKDRENRKKLKSERKMGKNKLKPGRSGAFMTAGDEMEGEGSEQKGEKRKDSKEHQPKSPKKKLPIRGKLDRNNAMSNKRRDWKDQKFGFGGKGGRDKKRNSAQSSADMSGFKSFRNSKPPLKRNQGNMNKRPGKLRRKQMKVKRARK